MRGRETARGPLHWRHGQRAQRAGEFYKSNVYELNLNCATGWFFTSAAGASSNRHSAG